MSTTTPTEHIDILRFKPERIKLNPIDVSKFTQEEIVAFEKLKLTDREFVDLVKCI